MIKLHHPYHVCVIERFPDGAEDRYFPLELLELVEVVSPPTIPTWLGGSLFREITEQGTSAAEHHSDDDDFNQGRDELSQDPLTW